MLERRGKKLNPASMPVVLWTKRCCHDNERSGNEVITLRLVASLRKGAILIFFASVECKQLDLTIGYLMAWSLK